ncbi:MULTISPECIES: hypothetical protein [unclassified Bradyrhizobium]|uniref:hypothetical protein n=1 Tax=unclassified Bradyrhizobium TaxID=2631580 RepID=UPI002915F39D|nr:MULTISPECIES: hypothetical protein [unclassified Bradyrhizobium]
MPVRDLLAGHAIDRDADPVEHHNRAVHLFEDVLVILRQLVAGFEREILTRLFPPIGLPVAVMVALEPALELAKQRLRIAHELSRALASAREFFIFDTHGILSR